METREKLSSEKKYTFSDQCFPEMASKERQQEASMFSSSNMFSKNGKQREEGVSEASHKSRIGNIGKRKGDLV